jgi:exodeoxyribonuclease V alpha subunit
MTPEPGISPLDRHFAALMQRLSGGANSELELASSLVSRAQSGGNVCLLLDQIAAEANLKTEDFVRKLKSSEMVGAPGELRPLILDSAHRLYLRRYWEYEQSLADAIRHRLEQPPPKIDQKRLAESLDRLFPDKDPTNQQRAAALTAVTKNFCVITGGPGTGKTHTVLAILALLLEEAGKPLRLALAAPSGKAAIRLQESVQRGKDDLNCRAEIKAWMPDEAATIHRLLGAIPESPYFRHNAEHQLFVDAVIVDEASMVDLATMAKLFQAVPLTARVILLGDKDQLASVEAGSVLGDICRASTSPPSRQVNESTDQLAFAFDQGNSSSRLQDSIIELRQNYRFSAESGIYQLVQAVNAGDADQVFRILNDSSRGDVIWRRLPDRQSLTTALAKPAANGFATYLKASDPLEALNRLGDFRVLCAIRGGPFGVENVNLLIEQALSRKELLEKTGQWYRGRPVMVTRNDYPLRLFNGDIGIILNHPLTSGEKRAWFNTADGRLRQILPTRLPAHETAFAITVHKSQGSEFGKVLFILPDTDSPLLTRELLYTALTRARQSVEIWGSEKVLRAAIGRQVTRNSGLRDALSD